MLDSTALATLVGLFIILSPGFLLTLPTLGDSDLTDLGVGFGDAPTITTCAGNRVNAVCTKAVSVWTSGYTTVIAVVVHSLVFAALLYYLPQVSGLSLPSFDVQTCLIFALLFGLLSPGLLLTLPPLSLTECGKGTGKKNIFDGTAYCNTKTAPLVKATDPKCYECTQFWMSGQTALVPVLVHGLVFGAVAYYVAQRL